MLKLAWLVLPLALTAVAVPITAGQAQNEPRTITVTKANETQAFQDVAPAGMRRGRVSLGDRLIATESLRIHGKPAGTMSSDATFLNRTPTTFAHFKALLHVVWRLPDGDLFTVGHVDPQNGGDRETIIAGTGTYKGAHGTVVGQEKTAVITIE